MSDDPILGPESLGPTHLTAGFDCGVRSLNDYLRRRALADQAAGKSRTYVVVRSGRVSGYFSLAASSIEPQDATERAAKGQGNHPVPAILLGRLAVALDEQGRGLGGALLVQALAKCTAAAETIGARIVLVHALDAAARAFYVKYGFERSPIDGLHLMMLMKDVRKTLG